MKEKIHPTYYTKVTIQCSCGATFITGSVNEKLQTEICAFCHPIYTGKKKTLDSTGRVDRFKKMTQKAQEKKVLAEQTKEAKKKREASRAAKAQEGERKVSKKKILSSKEPTHKEK
ncbi:MAG: 50S ribosomal protein L31 [Candidatus Moranbacteria bacterium]|nr:50S ribosomal protein L31 [Candidatus Moranbacteria bacterium]